MSAKIPPQLAPLDPAQRYSIEEATRYLRVSKPTLYLDIKAGRILTIQDEGRKRRYVPGSEIVRRCAAPAS